MQTFIEQFVNKHLQTPRILLFLICLTFYSCSDEEPEKEEDVTIPSKIAIYYSNDRGASFSPAYEAVRIGEYYWMNSNFNHITDHKVKREDIEKIIEIYRMNANEFNLSMDDFYKYYGSYYSRNYIEDMATYGQMYEGADKTFHAGWSLPYAADFRQLFAMCGNATIEPVMRFLNCKAYDNPAAIPVDGSGWITGLNRNIYGFNLLPTGAVFNGPNEWKPHKGENEATIKSNGGDLYGLLQAVLFPAHGGITVSIHDYPDTNGIKLWHYMPMRWCRRLTDKELGYKLYINQDQTDIQKLDLEDTVPYGYSELPNGYLRGFYVQYILDNPQPQKTVSELVRMTEGLR